MKKHIIMPYPHLTSPINHYALPSPINHYALPSPGMGNCLTLTYTIISPDL